MHGKETTTEERNLPIMTGQSTMAQAAWSMASPSIVLTFLAVTLEMPVFLIGALVSIRQFGAALGDVFLFAHLSRVRKRKLFLLMTDLALAASFVLAIIAALYGSTLLVIVVFVIVTFMIGLIGEVQTLILVDFISDNLHSKSRMRMRYSQIAFGGAIAIALTWVAHELTLDLEPLHRHAIVVTIATACFVVAGFFILAVRDVGTNVGSEIEPTRSPFKTFVAYCHNVRDMWMEPWFRKLMVLRLLFAIVILSVPFFALIAAQIHHGSHKGLATLITSAAVGAIVAGPLWRFLNGFSHRTVMVTSCLLVALSGFGLITAHLLKLDQNVHVHAFALFVATVAVSGLQSVRTLYFMDVAPKDQRVRAMTVARSLGRAIMVLVSTALAAIAHMHETVWVILLIVCVSLLAAVLSYLLAAPDEQASSITS